MARSGLMGVVAWLGLAGFVASLLVHVASLAGAAIPVWVFVLHLGIFAVIVPVALALSAWRKRATSPDEQGRTPDAQAIGRLLWQGIPMPQRVALSAVFAYAVVNFFVSAPDSPNAADPNPVDVRGFSGHWMAFYLGSAVYARRLAQLQQADEAQGLT